MVTNNTTMIKNQNSKTDACLFLYMKKHLGFVKNIGLIVLTWPNPNIFPHLKSQWYEETNTAWKF